MKYIIRSLLFLVVAGGAMVFAGGGGFEDPTGETGLQTEPRAKGGKLRGVVYVEFHASPAEGDNFALPVGRAVVRLKRGKQLETFYGEIIPGPDNEVSPKLVQELLTEGLKDEILAAFFPGKNGLNIKLQSFGNVGVLVGPANVAIATSLTCGIDPSQLPSVPDGADAGCAFGGSNITLMDVELVVPGIRPGQEDDN